MADVSVFFAVSSKKTRVSLRRYRGESNGGVCSHPDNWGYHNAEAFIGVMDERLGKPCDSGRGFYLESWDAREFESDERWPRRCACGYEFQLSDAFQVFQDEVLIRADGKPGEFSRRHPVVGMMYDCYWLPDRYGSDGWVNVGPDGLALAVCVPEQIRSKWIGREFHPEQRASNCTMRADDKHHCWVRHGDARKNECHVDKSGPTCAAGAGSIVTDGWHSFIQRNLVLGVPAGAPLAG